MLAFKRHHIPLPSLSSLLHQSTTSLPHHPTTPPSPYHPTTTTITTTNTTTKTKTKTKTSVALARIINSTPWSHHLETTLTPLTTTLSTTALLQTLHLITSPSKSLLFFKWLHTRPHLPLPHLPQSYSAMLALLARSPNLRVARTFLFSIPTLSSGSVPLHDRFFNALVLAYGRAGLLSHSISLFKKMKDLGVSPSVYSFNCLFSVLLRRGRTNLVKQMYYEMVEQGQGVKPDVYTFNILIRGFSLNSMVEEGFWFFKEMSRFGCRPDVITYNTLVDGLCRAGKVKVACNLVKGMCKKDTNLNPNVVTYTTLIRGYCEKQMVSEALELYDEMVSRGLKPNKVTHNTLIQGLSETGDFEKINEILQESGDFKPDTCTFNTLINAQCNAGNLDDALNVFERMSELQVGADSATYSVLIRSLCQKGEFEKAEELFDELSKKQIVRRNVGCVPLVAAYNPMFEYLCAQGKTKKADTLFWQLMKRGVQDPPAYKTLILGHCREGAFIDGYEILLEMLKREFVPDVEVYESLIEGFLKKGDSAFGFKTLEKMLKSGHIPKTVLFHSMLDQLTRNGCAREAASLVMVMLERRVRQNITLATNTVMALFKSQLKVSAFEIVRLLYNKGYSIKMEKVVDFLCGDKKFAEARELALFNLEKNLDLEVETYSKVIVGLCEIHRVEEAFSMFYELTERGHKLALSCLTVLKAALESDERMKESEFVSKRMSRGSRAVKII